MKKGGMYDAIMKFMGGGNMEYMQEGGKPDFLDLDKDGNKTESMKSAAASAKEMGKGGRMYRMGGMNEMGHGGVHKYPHGGVHNDDSSSDIQVMAKDSYKTADDPQPGRDFIYLVDGQPTDFTHSDIANLLQSEGITGKNLNTRMSELFTSFPSRGGSVEEERAFRKRQMDKVLKDVESIALAEKRVEGGGQYIAPTMGTGAMGKVGLGRLIKSVRRGDEAKATDVGFMSNEDQMKMTKLGEMQEGTPKNVNTDEFLRALARNFRGS